MPVENEAKYVLDDAAGALEDHLRSAPGVEGYDILQAYLDRDTRIRRFIALDSGEHVFVFSFKRKVGGSQIEIEKAISGRDFYALLPTAGIVLNKRRFKFTDGEVAWDIDFLKDGGATYFVLAEVEMPEGMEEPPRLPAEVSTHLLHAAGRGKAFGNRRLADPTYAAKALKELRAAARKQGRLPSCDPAEYAPRMAGLRAA